MGDTLEDCGTPLGTSQGAPRGLSRGGSPERLLGFSWGSPARGISWEVPGGGSCYPDSLSLNLNVWFTILIVFIVRIDPESAGNTPRVPPG